MKANFDNHLKEGLGISQGPVSTVEKIMQTAM